MPKRKGTPQNQPASNVVKFQRAKEAVGISEKELKAIATNEVSTPERQAKAPSIKVERAEKGTRQRFTESPIDMLLMRKVINVQEHMALNRLHHDIHKAGLLGPKGSSFEPRVYTGDYNPISEQQAELRMKLNRIYKGMRDGLGQYQADMVWRLAREEVFTEEHLLPMLKIALATLDALYRESS